MHIYKEYTQDQLNLQYNNRFHVPDFQIHIQQWENCSRETGKKYTVVKDIPYGSLPRECLDIFPSTNPDSKTLIFIHGGYWLRFDKSFFHFIAGAFAGYDITTVLINYPLMPSATMDQLVLSCQKAVEWVYQNIAPFNGNPAQLYIAGHSAGAHLAAMLLTTKELLNYQISIKGICTLSGLFNLLPIQLSNINEELQMDKDTAIRNSPAMLTPVALCPLLITAGSAETDEFKDQSHEFYNSLENKNGTVELIEIPGLNHFSILDSVYDQNSFLHKLICKLMGF